jgi:hypothetical protein
MKNIFATFLLFISFSSIAQQTDIRGTLKDATTKEPIISGTVGLKNSSVGTITNEEGAFQLTVSKTAQVIISCLGYKLITLNASDFTDETKTIFMEQNIEILEEVVISKTPIHQILEEIIAISKVRFDKPIVLNTYYREFVKTNGKYIRFSDGLLDYHISGDAQKTKSDLVVKQNRSVLLPISDEEEDDFDLGSILDIQKGYGYSFGTLNGYIIEDNKYEDYDLGLKSKKSKEGKEFLVITIEPKPEVEKALFKGTITYDPETKLIYDYDLFYAPSHTKYVKEINLLIARLSILDIKLKASYKMVNDNYLISNTNRYVKFKVWTKKHSTLSESRSDLLVTDFRKEDLTYNKKEVYTKKYLYKKQSQYENKFWQKNNAIVLTTEEEKIIDDLEKESKVLLKQN